MSSKLLIIASLIIVAFTAESARTQTQNVEEDLTVIRNWMLYSDAENGLYHHFLRQAFELLDARAHAVAAIDTETEWRARQKSVREAIAEAMGPFPEKTPLNARVVGTLQKDGYRVEKIVYESQPSFFVTAVLLYGYQLTAAAVPCSLIAAPLLAYSLHLAILYRPRR